MITRTHSAHTETVFYCRGMLRKLMAQHIFTIRRTNYERFYDEQYRVRRDFDRILAADADPKDIEITLEKYEVYIENAFEPYAAMHECRQHSNLWGKHVLWGDEALATDHIGFYSGKVKAFGEPSAGNYHEEYPHMVSAWVYDHQYLDTEFNYEDMERKYLASEAASGESASEARARLDQARN